MSLKDLNPFERKLELNKNNMPYGVRDALIFVHDTLEFCKASAETQFGEEATPEIIFEIYDRVVDRLEKERHREENE